MSKRVAYDENARQALGQGMRILAKVVSLTLGPKGRNVVLGGYSGTPQVTNDGATIVKEIELANPLENIGVSLLRQAALKTNSISGDGTTTATVLSYAIAQEGLKAIAAGFNPVLVKKGIEKAMHFVLSRLSQYARPVDGISDIAHVASISAGNDPDMGIMIARVIKKVGREGSISLQESCSSQTYLEILEGMTLDQGFMSPHFLLQSDKGEIFLDNPLVLLIDKKIIFPDQEFISALEQVASVKRSLLIIAEDISKEALAILIMNRLKRIVDVVAVRIPGFGNIRKHVLEDLAVLTGGQVVSDDFGLSLSDMALSTIGSAKCVTISSHITKIISMDNRESVHLRCQQISSQIERSTNSHEKEKLHIRLSKLAGRVAVINIGGSTEAEFKHRKLRFEDAISATRAAIDEGIVPGGGAALLHLGKELDVWAHKSFLDGEFAGMRIVSRALQSPLVIIAENAGLSGQIVAEQVGAEDCSMGYDANSNAIVNMYESGIIDPAKVTRSALQNALSIASIILTTECIIGD